jgi:23S rRNA (cytidine2498-2'-O)-methyltransferase
MAGFLFCAGQPASQALLKAEVARWRPELRLAFSRPGLLTFKADRPVSLDEAAPPLVFARVTGGSVCTVAEGAIAAAAEAARAAGASRVHAWSRRRRRSRSR